MPIYEFKCLNCNEHIEVLLMKYNNRVEMKCNNCNSRDLEKILSVTKCCMSRQEKDKKKK